MNVPLEIWHARWFAQRASAADARDALMGAPEAVAEPDSEAEATSEATSEADGSAGATERGQTPDPVS
jgi:hypothetical protein